MKVIKEPIPLNAALWMHDRIQLHWRFSLDLVVAALNSHFRHKALQN
ncbi:hypothetical protein PSE_1513 [Pseudovibrio sp. FO-BEG1]|nr:hypothetical protein PSE_1513 [Pseudovibrio sp. FO-BEG1]